MLRRYTRYIYVLLLFLLFLGTDVHASENYGFETTVLSENEKSRILSNIDLRKNQTVVTLDSVKSPLVSFDVSENETLLLGFGSHQIAVVLNGHVLSYFEFAEGGGDYYVQWQNDNILLYLVRSSVIAEVSQDGQLIDMIRADDKSIHNNSLWTELANRHRITVNGISYSMSNERGILNLFLPSFRKLIKTDADGNSTVLFDVGSLLSARRIITLVFIVAFLSLILVKLVQPVKKLNNVKGIDSMRNSANHPDD